MTDTNAATFPATVAPLTKRDLMERGLDALDPRSSADIAVSRDAGGITFGTAMEVMEFAKLMSVSGKFVPEFLRANPGGCMAVCFQAVAWRMDPFQVANKSYEVKDRIAYESQLIHALIETRAPLKKLLECRYDGEGQTRSCTVVGTFRDGEVREYTSPTFETIKTKNSPLWMSDPDQQLWYYSSRAWARKWCPNVILGVYTRDELAANPTVGREEEPPVIEGPSLKDRLSEADKTEGFQEGHAEAELARLGTGPKTIIKDAQEPAQASGKGGKGKAAPKGQKRTSDAPKGKDAAPKETKTPAKPKQHDQEPEEPRAQTLIDPKKLPSKDAVKSIADRAEQRSQEQASMFSSKETGEPANAAEYVERAHKWIDRCDPETLWVRWNREASLRNALKVGTKAANLLRSRIEDQIGEEPDDE